MAACLLSEGRRDTPPSMTWRRLAPWVILAITLLALYIDIPRKSTGATFLPLPDSIRRCSASTCRAASASRSTSRTRETGEPPDETDIETARLIIERRVAGLGVTEPLVRTEVGAGGQARIVVEVPGVSDREPGPPARGIHRPARISRSGRPDPHRRARTSRTSSAPGRSTSCSTAARSSRARSFQTPARADRLGSSFTLSPEAEQIWCDYTTRM